MLYITAMDSIIPLNGYILVEPYKEEKQGGFQIPDSSKGEGAAVKGKVIEISKQDYVSEYGASIPVPKIKVGDVIIHKQWGHQEVTVNMKKYRLVRHIDVCGVL